MHTKITVDNPYGYDRYGFAWQHVPSGSLAHLDFGCGDGSFLRALDSKKIARRVGVDISHQAAAQANRKHPDLQILHISRTIPLPFADGEFQSITLMDVLEHVYEQIELLRELRRVLRNDGLLIVTVPGKYLFSCLDMGNLKFRFPRLHRWYYCRTHSRQDYDRRYSSNPDGLIGDISSKKAWHEHFSRRYLKELLDKEGFAVREFDGAGFFSRPLGNVIYPFRRIRPIYQLFNRIINWDLKHFESANLFCLAAKNSS
jgi:SAM-dependent methyltransferase